MNSARNFHDPQAEEQASLYVLELLAPAERRDFEQALAGDAALRQLVRELQGNLDALVLAEPARSAPVQVWGRIAAEVKAAEAPVLGFPAWARAWGPRWLAAAACLALGALLHGWVTAPPKSGPSLTQAPTPSVGTGGTSETNNLVLPEPAPRTEIARTLNPIASTNTAMSAEVMRLRERVHVLAAQMSALNQVLTQQLALPDGVTRLHVYQLVGTNSPDLPLPEIQSLPETLAQLAAHQLATGQPLVPAGTNSSPNSPVPQAATNRMVATHEPTSATKLPNPVTPADPADPEVTSTNTVASTSTLQTASWSQPLGFVNPDTGGGAFLYTGALISNMSYVVWHQITDGTGAIRFWNVGTAAAAGGPTVIPVTTGANSSGAFLISIESTDTAKTVATPTGPIIAGPSGPKH